MGTLTNACNQLTFALRVAQKVPKAARVNVLAQQKQILCVEFKALGELVDQLKDTIQELNEDGRDLTLVTTIAAIGRRAVLFSATLTVCTSRVERMTKAQKIFLDEDREPFSCAIVRIQNDLRQDGHLTRSVPS